MDTDGQPGRTRELVMQSMGPFDENATLHPQHAELSLLQNAALSVECALLVHGPHWSHQKLAYLSPTCQGRSFVSRFDACAVREHATWEQVISTIFIQFRLGRTMPNLGFGPSCMPPPMVRRIRQPTHSFVRDATEQETLTDGQ